MQHVRNEILLANSCYNIIYYIYYGFRVCDADGEEPRGGIRKRMRARTRS